MKNQIYRLEDGDSAKLDFWIVDTNEVEPYRPIKELAVTVIQKEMQLDFDTDEDGIRSLIKYLEESLDYIEDFNSKSKPQEE